MRHGVKETNTLARLETVAENDHIPKELYLETRDAYEFQMQLRLVNQLRMIEANLEPNNYIDPAELSYLEKQTLKEAFAVIGHIQEYREIRVQSSRVVLYLLANRQIVLEAKSSLCAPPPRRRQPALPQVPAQFVGNSMPHYRDKEGCSNLTNQMPRFK